MTTKIASDANDCHARALADEETFTLLARDISAPATIVEWTERRLQRLADKVAKRIGRAVAATIGGIEQHEPDDDERQELVLIGEALRVATVMRSWRSHEITKASNAGQPPRWKRERMTEAKQPDGFSTESPIRAFTTFQVDGGFAVGKGFRPSISHLGRYMDAIERKEGWALLQVIMPDDDAGDPTMLFRKVPVTQLLTIDAADYIIPSYAHMVGTVERATGAPRTIGMVPELGAPYGRPTLDEVQAAVHPKHYDGTDCCEIIDHMPTNVGLAAKYIWRFGEKEPVEIELGKLCFYLERQLEIERMGDGGKPRAVFGFNGVTGGGGCYRAASMERIRIRFGSSDADVHRATALAALVSYTVTGRASFLQNAIGEMESAAGRMVGDLSLGHGLAL